MVARLVTAALVTLLVGTAWGSWPARRFGHFAYDVADEASLRAVDAARTVRLKLPAAQAFVRMRAAAARDGVVLLPVSGHRTIEHQRHKFEVESNGTRTAVERATDVAPPGYSEHHTGLTIDVDDGSNGGDRRVETRFEETRAYAWLSRHAARFGFEESFPADNVQGVAFEPWHWRYVGSDDGWWTFLPARLYTALASRLERRGQ